MMDEITKILFQGDSVTETARLAQKEAMLVRLNLGADTPKLEKEIKTASCLGAGYPNLIAAKLGYEYPGGYLVLNRGIGGNRIVDIYQRIKWDIINLEPDVVSVMVGINDVWHEHKYQNGVETGKFEFIYNLLLTEIKNALPHCRFILIEPFVLKGSLTKKDWIYFRTETDLRRAAVYRLSQKYGAKLVVIQDKLDSLSASSPEFWWTADGIHPTVAGHQVIAKEWLKVFFS
jgi:lysophospholipase L1-like esterase